MAGVIGDSSASEEPVANPAVIGDDSASDEAVVAPAVRRRQCPRQVRPTVLRDGLPLNYLRFVALPLAKNNK
jgi:hypothetical protein